MLYWVDAPLTVENFDSNLSFTLLLESPIFSSTIFSSASIGIFSTEIISSFYTDSNISIIEGLGTLIHSNFLCMLSDIFIILYL